VKAPKPWRSHITIKLQMLPHGQTLRKWRPLIQALPHRWPKIRRTTQLWSWRAIIGFTRS